ncbi:MAG: ECF transporter S component [Candidatus Hodarchaeota archaeon]
MIEKNEIKSQKLFIKSLLDKFQLKNSEESIRTIFHSLLGIGIYLLIAVIPKSYIVIGLFKLGIAPALAVIAVVGSIKGPIAGFLTGYLGTLFYDLSLYSTIVNYTLPYLAYGLMGFIVGLARYNPKDGRSLAKLSFISTGSFILAILLITVIGLTIEQLPILIVMGFVLLPLITVGIPSVFLFTPLYARFWNFFISKLSTKEI